MLKGVKPQQASKVTVSRQAHIEKQVLIKCECGAKILLLPDLKEMNCAIEAHVAKHKKMNKSTAKAKITIGKIRQNLTQQVIEKAAVAKQFS